MLAIFYYVFKRIIRAEEEKKDRITQFSEIMAHFRLYDSGRTVTAPQLSLAFKIPTDEAEEILYYMVEHGYLKSDLDENADIVFQAAPGVKSPFKRNTENIAS